MHSRAECRAARNLPRTKAGGEVNMKIFSLSVAARLVDSSWCKACLSWRSVSVVLPWGFAWWSSSGRVVPAVGWAVGCASGGAGAGRLLLLGEGLVLRLDDVLLVLLLLLLLVGRGHRGWQSVVLVGCGLGGWCELVVLLAWVAASGLPTRPLWLPVVPPKTCAGVLPVQLPVRTLSCLSFG